MSSLGPLNRAFNFGVSLAQYIESDSPGLTPLMHLAARHAALHEIAAGNLVLGETAAEFRMACGEDLESATRTDPLTANFLEKVDDYVTDRCKSDRSVARAILFELTGFDCYRD